MSQQQDRDRRQPSPELELPDDERGDEIRQRDALKDAGEPERRQGRPARHRGHREAETDQEKDTLRDAAEDRRRASAAFATPGERKGHRDAHDEDEPREHQVGERASEPVRMQQGRVDEIPVARVVDEDHRGDGRAAEDVERFEALDGGLHWRRAGRRRYFAGGSSVATCLSSHQHSGAMARPSMNSSFDRPNACMKSPMTSCWLG